MANLDIPYKFGDVIRHKGPKAKVLYAFVSVVSSTHCSICTFDMKTKRILKRRRISTKTLIEKYELDQAYKVLYGNNSSSR